MVIIIPVYIYLEKVIILLALKIVLNVLKVGKINATNVLLPILLIIPLYVKKESLAAKIMTLLLSFMIHQTIMVLPLKHVIIAIIQQDSIA
jgi:hypothetical protein